MRTSSIFAFLSAAAAFFGATVGFAGTATGINGLFFTGVNNSGGLQAGGTQDTHWTVVNAHVANTNYTGTSTYTGSSYVVSSQYIDGGWAPNTSSAQWITAPGARTSENGAVNVGGDFLPGNGTSGNNDAQYVYRLAFNIAGTGTGSITNQVSISLTIAADDRYRVYVNPTLNLLTNTINTSSSTLAASRDNAWNNTSAEYLQNFSNANGSANANFVVGTNYIYVVVDNTNSITGTSNSTAFNPSGLLVYQVGSAMTIDGKVVPEVGTMLPVIGALGLVGVRLLRRRKDVAATSPEGA